MFTIETTVAMSPKSGQRWVNLKTAKHGIVYMPKSIFASRPAVGSMVKVGLAELPARTDSGSRQAYGREAVQMLTIQAVVAVSPKSGQRWVNLRTANYGVVYVPESMFSSRPAVGTEVGIGLPSELAAPSRRVTIRLAAAEGEPESIPDIPNGGFVLETITRPAALVRQGSLKLYATSLKVSDLKRPNFYAITKLDPEGDGPGYQRLLNEGRAKRLAEYLLDGESEKDAFLPTSIFLATNKDIPFDPSTNTITFEVNRIGPFNVVDGQHRIAGLVLAAEKNDDLLQFEIPVNIAINLDDISQMCHFLIVNTTQRSVDKSIEQQIVARLTRMVGLERTPTIPRWIRRQVEKGEDARALSVANFLNTDTGSPWFGKIRMANDEGEGATINQKSFINSVKKYIFSANNPLSNPVWDINRPMILSNYWKAIVELLVDDQAASTSVIYKTTGVDLFHIASATVFTHLAIKNDFTKGTIKTLLERGLANLPDENIAMSHPEWWHRGGVASGLNSAAVRKLAAALSHALNVQENAGSISL